MYISLWENYRGHPIILVLCNFLQKIWWFRTKRFTGLWELIQLLWTIPIREIFHFHHLPKLYFGFNILNIIILLNVQLTSFLWLLNQFNLIFIPSCRAFQLILLEHVAHLGRLVYKIPPFPGFLKKIFLRQNVCTFPKEVRMNWG